MLFHGSIWKSPQRVRIVVAWSAGRCTRGVRPSILFRDRRGKRNAKSRIRLRCSIVCSRANNSVSPLPRVAQMDVIAVGDYLFNRNGVPLFGDSQETPSMSADLHSQKEGGRIRTLFG